MKKHLLEGVKKGAFDEAEALKRFEGWMKQNEEKIEAKKSGLEKSRDDEVSSKLAAEKKINEARAAKVAKKMAALAAKEMAENQPEATEETAPPADTAEVSEPSEAPEVTETPEVAEATEVTEAPDSGDAPSEVVEDEKPQE